MTKQSESLPWSMATLTIFVLHTMLSVASAEAGTCEKWKSEFMTAGATVTSYINAHRKYFDKKLAEGDFKAQTGKWLDKLFLLEVRAKAVDSCPHQDNKFEKRKDTLLRTLAVVIPLIKASEEVAPQIRHRLELNEKE